MNCASVLSIAPGSARSLSNIRTVLASGLLPKSSIQRSIRLLLRLVVATFNTHCFTLHERCHFLMLTFAKRAINACDLQRMRQARPLTSVLWRSFTTAGEFNAGVPLTSAAFQIWGANTGVGKSLLSAGVLRKVSETSKVVLYLKLLCTMESTCMRSGHSFAGYVLETGTNRLPGRQRCEVGGEKHELVSDFMLGNVSGTGSPVIISLSSARLPFCGRLPSVR